MIGAMVRKEIDVGGSPIFFRSERAKVVDFTARTWIARYFNGIKEEEGKKHIHTYTSIRPHSQAFFCTNRFETARLFFLFF